MIQIYIDDLAHFSTGVMVLLLVPPSREMSALAPFCCRNQPQRVRPRCPPPGTRHVRQSPVHVQVFVVSRLPAHGTLPGLRYVPPNAQSASCVSARPARQRWIPAIPFTTHGASEEAVQLPEPGREGIIFTAHSLALTLAPPLGGPCATHPKTIARNAKNVPIQRTK